MPPRKIALRRIPIKPLPKPKPDLIAQAFGNDPDNVPLPDYTPLHPAFTFKGEVYTSSAHRDKNLDGATYRVDLIAGTCNCKYGKPWQWHVNQQQWVRNFACSHKIRAMADIVENAGRPNDMMIAYSREVAARYNKYEVVSAFHKELRRRSVEHAMFWGVMLANFRQCGGVIRYMLNILYEETRDHDLGFWLLDALEAPRARHYDLMLQGIVLFCASKKKWELPHRMKFLEAEMRGYSELVKKFGRDVAKAGDIIEVNHREALMERLKAGIASKNLIDVQYGLKGLQKSKTADISSLRATIINVLTRPEIEGRGIGAKWFEFLNRRNRLKLGIGYHELNAYVDWLCGEPYAAGLQSIPAVLKRPQKPVRLGVAPTIPIYAHDNHTYTGKALIRKYPGEYQPGAAQDNYDLRLCGAYMGVVWRHLAHKQHGRIDCAWSDVKWPEWLHHTVSQLWY